MIPIVKEAGEIYLQGAKSDSLLIKDKGSSVNLITEYDKKIQDFLSSKFREIIPDCSFLEEEGDGNKEITDGYCFIIDPIDGTTNYIKKYQHSAISAALAKDGEIIAGIVYDPELDNMFYAEKGDGAFLNGEKIGVSDCNIESSLVLFGTCPYEHELAHKTFELTEKIFYKALEVRRSGSATLDICYVASGKADLYFEMILRPWDWAAAYLILTEAGGKALTFDKKEISAQRIDSFVCGNENILKDFYEILQFE